MTEPMPRPMVLDEFIPLIGREFIADCDPAEIGLTLTEAYPSKFAAPSDRPPFVLVFRTSPEAVLVEGVYTLRCGQWGPDMIHIWPTNPPPGGEAGYYYQAVFN